jgi:hypothetical protein
MISEPRGDAARGTVLRVPLVDAAEVVGERATGPTARKQEPVTLGVPCPRGRVHAYDGCTHVSPDGRRLAVQTRALDHWPDGSIRWLLVDMPVDDGGASGGVLEIGGAPADPAVPHGIQVSTGGGRTSVIAAGVEFQFEPGGAFPFSSVTVDGRRVLDATRSGIRLTVAGRAIDLRLEAVVVRAAGPWRAELDVTARAADAAAPPLGVSARVELFAATPVARVEITFHNRRRAQHPSGHWELGDRGSLPIQEAAWVLVPTSPILSASCAVTAGEGLRTVEQPFELFQESSGGDRWDGPIHRSASGRVPLRFRGYRWRSGADEQSGLRADPTVSIGTGTVPMTVAVPDFWQNFPRALTVDHGALAIGLFPVDAPEPTELQGGEQKTHRVVVAFGADTVTDPPLAWVHEPRHLAAAPSYVAETGAVPFLVDARSDPGAAYLALADLALDPSSGFFAKREQADEYGWRHFGDLPADHESAFQPPDAPFVSHYNNQYDAVAAFALHFLRTGDRRWWRLMDDLARHVRDIDIYRTTEDKAAYNGGLFWHTAHYVDAGLSTHRTYPRDTPGGGPSAEHNYNAGLMLHYFLTGSRASRDAAVGLGQWVIDMDDGRRSPFRWLARGATGLASFTVDFYGPGRGGGHSILACLTAYRLSGERRFLDKAEGLIARSIHPADDVDARGLLDAERRWSYTAFLQAIGVYLHVKADHGEIDARYAYARASLLRYAEWMAREERMSLSHPEVLEYPTETWAAQDLRKADVFLWAALLTTGAERRAYLDHARRFFDDAIGALTASPTRALTRPLVLLLGQGVRYGWFARHGEPLPAPPAAPAVSFPPAVPFVPQRALAFGRARRLAMALAVVVVAVAGVVAWLLW